MSKKSSSSGTFVKATALTALTYVAYKLLKSKNSLATPKKGKIIGTHNGTFHCDEILACYMLVNHTKEYRNSEIIRSRDNKMLSQCDILIDVGKEFNVEENKFDHHQRSFKHSFNENYDTKLSSCGLVYKYFGKEVIQNIINLWKIRPPVNNLLLRDNIKIDLNFSSADFDLIYNKLYESFIHGIDCIDNGINQYKDKNFKPVYSEFTNLSSRIKNMNPIWTLNDKNSISNDKKMLKLFYKCMKICGKELKLQLYHIVYSWFPSRNIVKQAMVNRFKTHKSGRIIYLDTYCDFLDDLFELEKELISNLSGSNNILYCVWKAECYRVRAIPIHSRSFELRKGLNSKWRGLREEQFRKFDSECKGIVFCHATGFIGGNKTKEGAIKMALLSINE